MREYYCKVNETPGKPTGGSTMKEQIAQWLSMSEKYGNFLVWDSLDNYTQENYRSRADRLIGLICAEIEEGLLTEDERIAIWETGENEDPFVDFERVAQAQLEKILKALEV